MLARIYSIVFQILCTFEATEMLKLAKHLHEYNGIQTIAVLHDALLVKGSIGSADSSISARVKSMLPIAARRISFKCTNV